MSTSSAKDVTLFNAKYKALKSIFDLDTIKKRVKKLKIDEEKNKERMENLK